MLRPGYLLETARLGMRREAHLIQNELFKGAWADELVCATLEDEWQARPRTGGPRSGDGLSGGRPG